MYCVHARKRASEAPKTHFRAGQISKFPGGVLPDPLCTIHIVEPHLLYLPNPLGGPAAALANYLLSVWSPQHQEFINSCQHTSIATLVIHTL